jgi:hypothetical protein
MNEGSYLMDKIRTRCVEEGDCYLWPGALSAGSSPAVHYLGKHYNLRHVQWEQMGKALPTDGKTIVTKCREKRCLAEGHLLVGSRSRPGLRRTPANRAKMAAISQARSSLTWDDIAEIRASSKTLDELVAEYRKSRRAIQYILSGHTWAVTTGHFAGLGARRS